jgi:hypothetical protein
LIERANSLLDLFGELALDAAAASWSNLALASFQVNGCDGIPG